jgi:ribosomal protein L37AE/L43A
LLKASNGISGSLEIPFAGVHVRNEKRQSIRDIGAYLGLTRSIGDRLEKEKGSNVVRQHLPIWPLAASSPGHLVCPVCSSGELQRQGSNPPLVCGSCGNALDGAVLRTLEQIVVLADAFGKHACECGHPEMGRLPDDVFHCPACGSEVLPIVAGL